MVVLRCPFNECAFATDDVETAAAVLILDIHARAHPQAVGSAAPSTLRGTKLLRPTVKLNSYTLVYL